MNSPSKRSKMKDAENAIKNDTESKIILKPMTQQLNKKRGWLRKPILNDSNKLVQSI